MYEAALRSFSCENRPTNERMRPVTLEVRVDDDPREPYPTLWAETPVALEAGDEEPIDRAVSFSSQIELTVFDDEEGWLADVPPWGPKC